MKKVWIVAVVLDPWSHSVMSRHGLASPFLVKCKSAERLNNPKDLISVGTQSDFQLLVCIFLHITSYHISILNWSSVLLFYWILYSEKMRRSLEIWIILKLYNPNNGHSENALVFVIFDFLLMYLLALMLVFSILRKFDYFVFTGKRERQ